MKFIMKVVQESSPGPVLERKGISKSTDTTCVPPSGLQIPGLRAAILSPAPDHSAVLEETEFHVH